jgi:maleylacetoacetate isomerase
MKLYSFFNSSASFRVRIALALKGIDYEFVGVDIRSGEQAGPDYLGAVSASPLVPALEDGDLKISQSMAILDYLDQVAPEPRLIPVELKARARELEFANIIACDTHPLNNLRILKYFGKELKLDADTVQTWYQKWIDVGVSAAESMLQADQGGNKFCFASQPTLADCVLIPQIANALRKGCDMSAFPRCMSVYEYAMSQEAFKVAAPETQPDYIAP